MPLYVQVILFSVIALVWIWIPTMFFLGTFLGWYDLARHFPRVTPPRGARHGSTSFVLPPFGQYANIVQYARDDDYLHIRLLPIFLFHQPMSIPWAEIEVIGPHPNRPAMLMTLIRGRDALIPAALLEEELRIRGLSTDADADEITDPPHET